MGDTYKNKKNLRSKQHFVIISPPQVFYLLRPFFSSFIFSFFTALNLFFSFHTFFSYFRPLLSIFFPSLFLSFSYNLSQHHLESILFDIEIVVHTRNIFGRLWLDLLSPASFSPNRWLDSLVLDLVGAYSFTGRSRISSTQSPSPI